MRQPYDGSPDLLIEGVELRVCDGCGLIRLLSDRCPLCKENAYSVYDTLAQFRGRVNE